MNVTGVVSGAALAALLLVAGAARADDSEAERLFKEGRSLMSEGKFAEACPRLEESQRLEPRGGTLLNVAACHERAGQLPRAWDEYNAALVWAQTEGQTARAQLAQERLTQLETRLAWLTIVLPPEVASGGARIRVDGIEVRESVLGHRMPVGPGSHRIVAAYPDGSEWEQSLVLGEAEGQTVVVRRLVAPAPAEASFASVTPPGPRALAPEVERDRGLGAQRVAGLIAGGTGLGVLGLGIYFATHAQKLHDETLADCAGNNCTVHAVELDSASKTSSTTANVLFVTSGVLVAGGGLLYLTAPSSPSTSAGVAHLQASFGPGGMTVSGAF